MGYNFHEELDSIDECLLQNYRHEYVSLDICGCKWV